MKQHRYRVTLEYLAGPHGEKPEQAPLFFEAANHDDIFAIVERMRSRPEFDREEAAALAVGLKLFSEVMLTKRELPLFASFVPHFVEFMKTLKKGPVS